ncbi:MAG: hypothetical protein P1S60_18390, partial [Anaerolineae bacterium]|nr:hypothetical protein [Anaerolineae bacterium]
MVTIRKITVAILAVVALSACQIPVLPSSYPTVMPSVIPQTAVLQTDTPASEVPVVETPTATASPHPSPTPTQTAVPTYEPDQLLAAANDGLGRILDIAGERSLVCLRYEDLNADGVPEWLALTHQNNTPANMNAFILDAANSYPLEPAPPKPGLPDVGFGQFPVCHLVIQDINQDGKIEIAIFGHTQDHETLLHLFAWDAGKAEYARLGYFSGDAGIELVEADGELAMEIWEGYRIHEAPSLTWYV